MAVENLIMAYNAGFYRGFFYGIFITLIIGFLIIILFNYVGKNKK